MPPRNRYTREDIIQAALELTRAQGFVSVTARALGEKLGCSTKPIFGLFQNMEEVQQEVLKAANVLYKRYLQEDMARGEYPAYKASGMGYIRFAREEKELFKLLYMRDRSGETIQENREEIRPILAIIQKNLGISEDDAFLFHLEMWVYVHGLATMVATSYLDWDMDFISRTMTDAYMGIRSRFMEEKENGSH